MNARVMVRDDWYRDGIALAFSVRDGDQSRVLTFPGFPAYVEVAQHEALDSEAWLQLPDDVGRALYEALSRHYGGHVVDATVLRQDYVAERARVDQLLGALVADTNRSVDRSAVR